MDNKFEPNEEILNHMMSMGIPQTVAIQVKLVKVIYKQR